MRFKLTTEATGDPLTTQEVKDHLLISHSLQDDELSRLQKAAVIATENLLNMALLDSTWELHLDDFSEVIRINKNPVTAITSVKYYNEDNTEVTMNAGNYVTDLVGKPARIEFDEIPGTYDRINALIITFQAGYSSASDVPEDIKQSLKNMIADWYVNRQDSSPVNLTEIPFSPRKALENYLIMDI